MIFDRIIGMYPKLFGLIDSYTVMILLGVIGALVTFFFYLRRQKMGRNEIIDLLWIGIVSVIAGIIFACLFENLYELIENPAAYHWTWGMTFIGGAIGGAGMFLLLYFLYYKKHHKPILREILVVAPGCITLAHAVGRIGCFLDGCCYGKETTAWYGIYFPTLGKTVIPTQLFEAAFLFVLSAVLIVLAFKLDWKYTFPVYLISYAVFRFLIEFIRGDERGAFLGPFSPSQIWCFVLCAGGIALIFILRRFMPKAHEEQQEAVADDNEADQPVN